MKIAWGVFGIFIVLMLLAAPVNATDQLDLSTGLKTLLLMTNRFPSPIIMAVVFDPANPESKTDAETIKSNVDNGTGVPSSLKVNAQMVSVTDFPNLSGVKIAFLAANLGPPAFDTISRAAAASGILTVSTDLDCVKTNKCTFGIVTKPRVEIYYSSVAAEASRISFTPAFIMLVKQF